MEIISVKFSVFWQVKTASYYKITKCKKIINTRTGKILIQRVKGGAIGWYINKGFIKRSEINNHIEKIPIKIYCPF